MDEKKPSLNKKKELVAFGNRIKKLRLSKGKKISQEQLSLISGLNRNYISDVERGTRNLSFSSIIKIIEALDCSVAEFFANGFEGLSIIN